MNLIDLKIVFRTLSKQKLSTSLCIFVLMIGMASFMVIISFIGHEKSYDQSWDKPENIYRIALEKTLKNGNIIYSAKNFAGLSRIISDEIPDIKNATSLWEDIVTAYTIDNCIQDVKLFWTDKDFFSVFNCPFVAGSSANPFPTIQSAIISESVAIRLFGKNNPVNERFELNEGWEFIVAGVFKDIPSNSHLKIDFLISRESLFYYMSHFNANTSTLVMENVEGSSEPAPTTSWLWQNPQAYTYIRLKENNNINGVEQNFDQIYEKYTQHLLTNGEKSRFILQPLQSIHRDSHLDNEMSPNSDRNTLKALYIIAVLILIMSWVIIINFQITRSIERAKEIGMKKIAGAKFWNLSLQILLQSLFINFTGMAMAFLVFFSIRRQLSHYLDIFPAFSIHNYLFLFVGIFIAGIIVMGLYPSVIIVSKRAQTLISKNFSQKYDGFNLRRALIVFQFAASIGLLIASTIIILQVNYMKSKEIGINIQNTIYTYTPMSMIKKDGAHGKLMAFFEELYHIPGVKGVTVNSCIPGKEINFHSNSVYPAGRPENKGDNFGIETIDYRYQEVYHPTLVAGRMFSKGDAIGHKQLIVNKEASRKLGYNKSENIVNEFIMLSASDLSIRESQYQVIGVINDFHQESLRSPIEPVLLLNDNKWKYDVGYISILIENSEIQSTLALVKQKWETYYPNDTFNIKYTDDTYQDQMKADEKLATILSVYTVLSIFLAFLGLFGLASNAAKKRIKEIGIRKVNGARLFDIIAMLNREFIRWVAIAYLVAAPLAWLFMHQWLQNFAYRISISWWVFVFAGAAVVVLAMSTVTLQSWKAASRNPVECLRYE